MEGINSSLQVHEGTQSFAGRGEQLVSVTSEDSIRQQGLKWGRWDFSKMLGRSGEVQGEFRMHEGIGIIIFLESFSQNCRIKRENAIYKAGTYGGKETKNE